MGQGARQEFEHWLADPVAVREELLLIAAALLTSGKGGVRQLSERPGFAALCLPPQCLRLGVSRRPVRRSTQSWTSPGASTRRLMVVALVSGATASFVIRNAQ